MHSDSLPPQVCTRFRQHLKVHFDRILAEWLRVRQQRTPSEKASRKSDREWMDHLPEILEEVIDGFSPVEEVDESTSRDHAKQRNHLGFTAEAAVYDLHLLGKLLRRELRAFGELDGKATLTELLKLQEKLAEILEGLTLEAVRTLFSLMQDDQNLREGIFRRKIQLISDAYEDKRGVLDGYSHDLKGCTAILLKLTESIQQKNGDEANALLATLAFGLEYNYRILADLEALSRDTRTVETMDLDFSKLVKDLWTRMAFPGSRASRCAVEWLDSDPVRLKVDTLALERVVSNLLENALLHGREGQSVQIGWWKEPDGNVRFEIENEVDPSTFKPECSGTEWVEEPFFPDESTGISVIRSLIREMEGHLGYRLAASNRVRARVVFSCPGCPEAG